jgi:hypothetical protein
VTQLVLIVRNLVRTTWFRIAGYHRLVLWQTSTDEGDRERHDRLCSDAWEPIEATIIPLGVKPGIVGAQPEMVMRIIWTFRRECGEHWVKPAALIPLPAVMRQAINAEAAAQLN